MDTPLLLIIYNRPLIFKKLLEALREVTPRKIYVFCDGPRSDKDKEKVLLTRKMIEKIDWKCDLKIKFNDNNLGCQKGVSSAISWFFEQESCGVILEDDCVPSKSFFTFTSALLKKYKDDLRISMISGSNLGFTDINERDSYFYSRHSAVWGWGTWADRWKVYNKHRGQKMNQIFSDENIRECKKIGITNKFILNSKKSFEGELDSWAYLWTYFNLIENRLSVIPANNFIENIGFGRDATHTKIETSQSRLKRQELTQPISHPASVIVNDKFESYISRTHNTLYVAFNAITLIFKKIFKLL